MYDGQLATIAAWFAGLLTIVGVLGNVLTIAALLAHPKLRRHALTAFVLSLATSDLLFCSFNLPLTSLRFFHQRWIFGDGLCSLFPLLFYGNVAVSLASMIAISLNRFVLISYNHLYSTFYSRKAILWQIVVCWLLPFSLLVPPLAGIWGKLGLDEATFSCTILEKDGRSPKKLIFVVGFLVPCILIIISYLLIYCKVVRSRKASGKMLPSIAKLRREKDDRRLTLLMCFIFACFIACFLPLTWVNVFDDAAQHPNWHVLASMMAWLSSVVNPLVYAATNKQYRAAFALLFSHVDKYIFSCAEQL